MSKIDLTVKSSAAGALSSLLGGDMGGGERIVQIKICELTPYENQPFHGYDKDKLGELAEDIKASGILSPIIVQPQAQGYRILAGHNRTKAAKLAGLDSVPCIVKDVDDEAAKLILVNTNLCQREKILPGEKAFAYKMLLENKGEQSMEALAYSANENSRQIYRYIRLTKLTKDFLRMVDCDEIPLNAGVDLSFLPIESQELLYEFVANENIKLGISHAKKLKEMGSFTMKELAEFFFSKAKPAKAPEFAIKRGKLDKYFADEISDEQIEAVVLEALKMFFSDKLSRD